MTRGVWVQVEMAMTDGVDGAERWWGSEACDSAGS